MWLSMLGPLQVRDGDAELAIPAAKQRIVLATLLFHASQVVSFDQLAGAVWDNAAPAAARPTLRNYVKRLRMVLGPAVGGRIQTRSPGYWMDIGDDELDLLRFAVLVGSGGEAVRSGAWERAGPVLTEALGLWRGAPLADIPSEALHREEMPRLEQLHLQALEWRHEAQLHLGGHEDLVPQLRALVTQHPLHERFRAQLMLGYYRCGRQAEALAAYQDARRALVEELGVEPGAELRTLHRQILVADPELSGPVRPGPSRPGCQEPPGTAEAREGAGGPPAAGGGGAGRGSPAPPQQLPPGPPYFTGRDAELATLNAALHESGRGRTVVISAIGGSAGVGKSALALHWAHQVANTFPDGQLYANLRGFDPSGDPAAPSDVLHAFLDAFHLAPAAIPAGLQAQAGLYRSVIAGRRMLIILDNARDAEQVRPLLPGSSGSLVIVTSRNRLTGLVASAGAHPITLGLFTDEEAARLLARRLGAGRLAAEPAAVTDLIRLCARLPLAVSIAAARAAMSPGLTLGAIAAELNEARLDALATGEAATDIRAMFAWSYHGLSEPAAHLFRLLGVHTGPDIGMTAAASMAGLPTAAARKVLAELSEAQLIQGSSAGRFALHDLLRAYAAEEAAGRDSQETRAAVRRMLDHYLSAAWAADRLLDPLRPAITPGAPGPGVTAERLTDYDGALAWFKAEHRVLAGAVTAAAQHGFDTHAWQLAWALTTYFNRCGHWQDWAGLHREALRSAKRLADPAAQARIHNDLGRACLRLGAAQEAVTHQRQALALFARLGDQLGQARGHIDLGRTFSAQRRYGLALEHAGQALSLAEAAGSQVMAAGALNNIGWYHACLGDHARSLSFCSRALAIFREIGSQDGEAQTLDSIGYAYHHLGRPDQAVTYYQRALGIFLGRAVGYDQAYLLSHLGEAQRDAGDLDAARETWGRAATILEELHHPEASQLRARLDGLAVRQAAGAT